MASVRPPCEWTSPVLFKNVEITGLLSSNEISHGHRSKQGYSGQREERGLEPLLRLPGTAPETTAGKPLGEALF